MGNLDDGSCNYVQKDIVYKIGNKKEKDKSKGDDDQGQTNKWNVRENKEQNKYYRDFPKISSNFDKQNPPRLITS